MRGHVYTLGLIQIYMYPYPVSVSVGTARATCTPFLVRSLASLLGTREQFMSTGLDSDNDKRPLIPETRLRKRGKKWTKSVTIRIQFSSYQIRNVSLSIGLSKQSSVEEEIKCTLIVYINI